MRFVLLVVHLLTASTILSYPMRPSSSRKSRGIHEITTQLESRLAELRLEERKLKESGRELWAHYGSILQTVQTLPRNEALARYSQQVQHATNGRIAALTLLRDSIQALQQELEQARRA